MLPNTVALTACYFCIHVMYIYLPANFIVLFAGKVLTLWASCDGDSDAFKAYNVLY